MRVLSLHNNVKFGCFISINDKIVDNLLWWGRFQLNFRRPLAAKLWMGAKKKFWPKMMARTTSITMQNLVEIARRTSAWEDEMWYFSLFYLFLFLKITLHGRRRLWCIVDLLPEDIASTFVGRFRWRLHPFCGRKALTFLSVLCTVLVQMTKIVCTMWLCINH